MAAVIGALRVDLGLNSAEFEQGMKRAQNALAGIGKAFAALGGLALFAGFSDGINQAVGRIEEMRKLTSQLDRALANTGNTAKTSGDEVAKFADRLERETGRAAEEVMAVSTNLATFGFDRGVFFEAIELADDMSAAWGGDLKQNVEGLARALADPEKGLAMLTKRGITFTDQQKKMIEGFIKANNLVGAQGVVLDALNDQVKGVASAGFGGLTKAQANATLAVENFFETVATSIGAVSGMEMSLMAVATALDFVSEHFGTIARAAGVAGAAILTALGPTIWATISAAASAMTTSVLAGLTAIKVAVLNNPIGAIAVALAAALTAAVLFRDEIKKVIGIDFVGVVIDAANKTIGAFVGAYDAIKEQWSNLPTFFSAIGKRAYNSFLSSFEGPALTIKTPWGSWESGGFDLSGAKAQLSEAEMASFGKTQATFKQALDQDYFGEIATSLGFVGDQAGTASSQIAGLGAAMDGGGTGGGAAGSTKAASQALRELADAGVAVWEKTRTPAENYAIEIERLNMLLQKGAIDQDTYNRAVTQAQDAFQQAEMSGNQLASSLASGLANVFSSVIDGSKSAIDAIGDLLKSLGQLLINQAFQGIIGGLFGGGGLGGLFGGLKLPSFDGGGYTGMGAGPGLDGKGGFLAMLHPDETVVDHSKGQRLGGPTVHISISGSQQDAAAIAREVRRVLPDAMKKVDQNPYRRRDS